MFLELEMFIMARVVQKIQVIKTKTRVRKVGGNSGYKPCRSCGGTGRVRA